MWIKFPLEYRCSVTLMIRMFWFLRWLDYTWGFNRNRFHFGLYLFLDKNKCEWFCALDLTQDSLGLFMSLFQAEVMALTMFPIASAKNGSNSFSMAPMIMHLFSNMRRICRALFLAISAQYQRNITYEDGQRKWNTLNAKIKKVWKTTVEIVDE